MSSCSHGAYERAQRRLEGDLQRGEAGEEASATQAVLQGYCEVSHGDDETR